MCLRKSRSNPTGNPISGQIVNIWQQKRQARMQKFFYDLLNSDIKLSYKVIDGNYIIM